jgi:hypothetical protein
MIKSHLRIDHSLPDLLTAARTGDFRPVRLFAARLVLLGLTAAISPSAVAQEAGPDNKRPSAKESGSWQSLFDGKTLGPWKVIDEYDFEDHGKVRVDGGRVILEKGSPATGIRWTGEFPRIDFEASWEAMRVEGEDFFCGASFRWNDSPLTLVLGGWDGSVVGLSSINGEPAVENETCGYVDFEQKRWYRVRLRVTQPKIEVWLDEKKIVDLPTADRRLSIYWEMEPCLPFGFATWYTTGALRNIKVRSLKAK